jgi:hypothetical protein
MKITDKRELANKVWAALQKKLRSKKASNLDVYVGSYQNGREQGISLHVYLPEAIRGLWLAFSENRNSDSIVVYQDDHDPMQCISEKAYANRVFFNKVDVAVAHLLNVITDFIKNPKPMALKDAAKA